MSSRLINVNNILAGHVTLDIECLERPYLNGYVPHLQVGGQLVQYLLERGFPIPSPAIIEKMGSRFRDAVNRFAPGNNTVWFGKNDRKITVMELSTHTGAMTRTCSARTPTRSGSSSSMTASRW